MINCLTESYFFNFTHPAIQERLSQWVSPEDSLQEKAVKVYYFVRDGWKYNPYNIHLNKEGYRANVLMERSEGHCLDKSIILIACFRSLGIPAKLHLAKVRNHIATEKLTEILGTDVLTPHGFVDVYLNDQWLKVTPAFNKTLCEKLNVAPLEFDGLQDSFFQEFDKAGSVFMEYLEDYGSFEDVPLDFIFQNMRTHYPVEKLIEGQGVLKIK